MNLFDFKKVLVLNPHGDDSEINCGGTIINLINKGSDVFYACFSLPTPIKDSAYSKEKVIGEVKRATGKLGIKESNLIFFDYPIRRFNEKRQEILDELLRLKKELAPDLVFCHSSFDIHQDHKVIYEETLRAFKNVSILGYESHWNQITGQDNRVFVCFSEEILKKKIEAIKEYKSQEGRSFFSGSKLKAIAEYHGMQTKNEFCEVFECIRLVSTH